MPEFVGYPQQEAPKLGYNSASGATDPDQESILSGLVSGLFEQAQEGSKSMRAVIDNSIGAITGLAELGGRHREPQSAGEQLKNAATSAVRGAQGLLSADEDFVQKSDEVVGGLLGRAFDTTTSMLGGGARAAQELGQQVAENPTVAGVGRLAKAGAEAHPVISTALNIGQGVRDAAAPVVKGVGTALGQGAAKLQLGAERAFEGDTTSPPLEDVLPSFNISESAQAAVEGAQAKIAEGAAVEDGEVAEVVSEGVRARAAAQGEPITEEEEKGLKDRVLESLKGMREGEKIDLLQAGIGMLTALSNPETPLLGVVGQGLQSGVNAAQRQASAAQSAQFKNREIGAQELNAKSNWLKAQSASMQSYLNQVGASLKGEVGLLASLAAIKTFNPDIPADDQKAFAGAVQSRAMDIQTRATASGQPITGAQAIEMAIEMASLEENPNAVFKDTGIFTDRLGVNKRSFPGSE